MNPAFTIDRVDGSMYLDFILNGQVVGVKNQYHKAVVKRGNSVCCILRKIKSDVSKGLHSLIPVSAVASVQFQQELTGGRKRFYEQTDL